MTETGLIHTRLGAVKMGHIVMQVAALSFTMVGTLSHAFEPLPAKPPIPKDNPQTPAKIELGKQLYFDPRLSKTENISCNTCHNLMAAGVDGTPFSLGVGAVKGARNSPTVWNAAFMSVQFWDGRGASLEEQSKGPLINPAEMQMGTHDAVVTNVSKYKGYVEQFKKVFPNVGGVAQPSAQVVTIDRIGQAIAAYERTLVTPNSPFDKFMRGNKKAMTNAGQRGWKLVQTVGCVACHNGPMFASQVTVGANGIATGFMKFPLFPGSEYEKKYDLTKDQGRYEVTHQDADRNLWRVPTWRNVAVTGPYFHNGSVVSLDEAVRVMAKTQLNKELKAEEVSDIVEFLRSLTGEFPKQTMPRLPLE